MGLFWAGRKENVHGGDFEESSGQLHRAAGLERRAGAPAPALTSVWFRTRARPGRPAWVREAGGASVRLEKVQPNMGVWPPAHRLYGLPVSRSVFPFEQKLLEDVLRWDLLPKIYSLCPLYYSLVF